MVNSFHNPLTVTNPVTSLGLTNERTNEHVVSVRLKVLVRNYHTQFTTDNQWQPQANNGWKVDPHETWRRLYLIIIFFLAIEIILFLTPSEFLVKDGNADRHTGCQIVLMFVVFEDLMFHQNIFFYLSDNREIRCWSLLWQGSWFSIIWRR